MSVAIFHSCKIFYKCSFLFTSQPFETKSIVCCIILYLIRDCICKVHQNKQFSRHTWTLYLLHEVPFIWTQSLDLYPEGICNERDDAPSCTCRLNSTKAKGKNQHCKRSKLYLYYHPAWFCFLSCLLLYMLSWKDIVTKNILEKLPQAPGV